MIMARKVQYLFVDDLDGTELGENGETVAFALGSERYEIDLSPDNAEKFRNTLGQYVQAARNVTRVGGGSRSHATGRRGSPGRRDRDETKAARAWLVEQGILSPESRGRISAENWEKYRNRGQLSTETPAAEAAAGDETGGTPEKPRRSRRGNSQTAEQESSGMAEPVSAVS
jgi:hypothetical protein